MFILACTACSQLTDPVLVPVEQQETPAITRPEAQPSQQYLIHVTQAVVTSQANPTLTISSSKMTYVHGTAALRPPLLPVQSMMTPVPHGGGIIRMSSVSHVAPDGKLTKQEVVQSYSDNNPLHEGQVQEESQWNTRTGKHHYDLVVII